MPPNSVNKKQKKGSQKYQADIVEREESLNAPEQSHSMLQPQRSSIFPRAFLAWPAATCATR
jgi:hypothetical protein